MTHNTREEWEREFEDKFSAFTFNNGGALELTLWDVVDERIHPTNEIGFEIYNFIHHQLQKAREEERERILSWCKRNRETLNCVNETWEVVDYEELMKTSYTLDHSELDQPNK